MSDDEAQLFARIPASLKYLVDQDDRQNKEIVVSALEKELGVQSEDSVAVIDRRIKRLEDDLEEEKAQLEQRRERLQTIQSQLEDARSIREQKVEEDGSYEDRLDEILDQMESGDLQVVFPTHAILDELRNEFDRSNQEMHLDLQQRAAAQDRDLVVADFKQALRADDEDRRTPISEKWDGGESA